MRAMWTAVLAGIILAASALAQDSVSTDRAFGDALYPWLGVNPPGEPFNTFVVDTQVFTSGWDNRFSIAPLIKASKVSSQRYSSVVSAKALSNTLRQNVPFPFTAYSYWNTQGGGVNDLYNTPGTPLSPTGLSNQCALGYGEFGSDETGGGVNQIIGAVVNYLPKQPGRLYVARMVAAANAALPAENRSQFGFGGADADGNVHFRADGFGTTGPNKLTGNNYFRVRLVGPNGRNYTKDNVIDDIGGQMDITATDWLLVKSAVSHNTPSILPTQLGTRPVLLGSNFNIEYVRESTPGTLTADKSHLAPGITDHRAGVMFSHRLTCLGGVGMAGLLGKIGTPTNALNLWGVDANGAVQNKIALTLPPAGFPEFSPKVEFGHYGSQVACRGGNSTLALGEDQKGRALAAGVIYDMTYTLLDNPWNAIAVARFDCNDPGAAQWALAGWVANTSPGTGKPITDGTGKEIGRMCTLAEVTGGAPLGPSMSAPVMDSVGNLYFLAACRFYAQPQDELHNALLRAVYNPDAVNPADWYALEVIFRNRQIFRGQNSDTDYQISYLPIADNNSINSSTLWSSNILQTALNNMNPANLNPADPRALGGLLVTAEIIYDVNRDGLFERPPGGGIGGPDEFYNAVLYVASGVRVLGDLNCDQRLNFFDIDPFVLALTNPAKYVQQFPKCDRALADVNLDGKVNFFDIDPFVILLTGK